MSILIKEEIILVKKNKSKKKFIKLNRIFILLKYKKINPKIENIMILRFIIKLPITKDIGKK